MGTSQRLFLFQLFPAVLALSSCALLLKDLFFSVSLFSAFPASSLHPLKTPHAATAVFHALLLFCAAFFFPASHRDAQGLFILSHVKTRPRYFLPAASVLLWEYLVSDQVTTDNCVIYNLNMFPCAANPNMGKIQSETVWKSVNPTYLLLLVLVLKFHR